MKVLVCLNFNWRKYLTVASGALLVLLASCSSTPVYPPANITMDQAWASVDWSGEGRGELTYNHKQDRFSVEAALDREAHTWIMAVRIPLLGEEHFSLDFKTGLLSGPLWERWQKENPRGDISSLKQALINALNLKKVPLKATWDQHQLKFSFDENIHWTFDWWKQGRFHKIKVEITGIYEHPLALELIWREETAS